MLICEIDGCTNIALTGYGPNVCYDHFWTRTKDEVPD